MYKLGILEVQREVWVTPHERGTGVTGWEDAECGDRCVPRQRWVYTMMPTARVPLRSLHLWYPAFTITPARASTERSADRLRSLGETFPRTYLFLSLSHSLTNNAHAKHCISCEEYESHPWLRHFRGLLPMCKQWDTLHKLTNETHNVKSSMQPRGKRNNMCFHRRNITVGHWLSFHLVIWQRFVKHQLHVR